MTNGVLSARDARPLPPAVTPLPITQRAAVMLRRVWRSYLDRQARRAIAVMLHAMDVRALDDIGVNRDEIKLMFDTE